MNEDVHNIGGQVNLRCSTGHHYIGQLVQRTNVPTDIEYWPRDGGGGQPWPPRDDWGLSTWWTVPCPDGCPDKFGGPVDIIRQHVNEVGNDPKRTEGEYTLIRAEP